MNKTDCFAFIPRGNEGAGKCNALVKISCEGCKFYKTKSDFEEEERHRKEKK